MLPIKAEQVKQATSQDPVLVKVCSYIVKGWPTRVESELTPFLCRQEQLTIEAGCVLCGIKVVVPAKLRKAVLEEIHAGHPGIVRMKSVARLHVWWPGIDTEVETLVRNCAACQSIRNNQPPTTLHPWAWPNRP